MRTCIACIKALLLGWYRHNCIFCIVEICHLILEYILKCGLLCIILTHISYFIFLANLLPAVYFVFILGYENDVRQKANLSNFLI